MSACFYHKLWSKNKSVLVWIVYECVLRRIFWIFVQSGVWTVDTRDTFVTRTKEFRTNYRYHYTARFFLRTMAYANTNPYSACFFFALFFCFVWYGFIQYFIWTKQMAAIVLRSSIIVTNRYATPKKYTKIHFDILKKKSNNKA